MPYEASLRVLRDLDLADGLSYDKTLHSAVTTSWRVNWSEEYIARDLLQNFYDANRADIGAVRVDVDVFGTVTVSAPAEHTLERLFYLGSEKGADDIGQYGEGFKAAATCLLRNHGVNPVAFSAGKALCLRIADEAVEGTQMFPLVYDFFTTRDGERGTKLVLPRCSKVLAEALMQGMSHFFHPSNPLVGELLWGSSAERFALYRATTPDGWVFYRGMRRGRIPGLSVVLVIDEEVKPIETRIKADRDRNAFGDKLMAVFYEQFVRKAIRYRRDAQRAIVDAARPVWEKGHGLLNAIATHASTDWPAEMSRDLFQDRYFARSVVNDAGAQLAVFRLEQSWQAEGLRPLPHYFSKFGVKSAWAHIREVQLRASAESKRLGSRPPSEAEQLGVQTLRGLLDELAPTLAAVLDQGRTRYVVAATDVLLGQLREGRKYKERVVFLAQDVFVSNFAEAVAVFLHEHAHIFGYDGDRAFTDELTTLIEVVIRERRLLDAFEAEWTTAVELVAEERRTPGCQQPDDVIVTLDAMGEAELRQLVAQVPRATLRRLLK